MSDDRTMFQPKPPPPQGSLRPGVRLNGMFEIVQLIAEGGMGEVYKGVAVASGDAVAIKLVRPEMARDPEVMALFRREAAILHDLPHEAIVRYYVFSLDQDLQRFYIAMEFVDGVSLQKRLVDGPLDAREARILLRRIGGALEKAHDRGVIHRDISSDNIILPGGDVRNAKIVDFGIARAARPDQGTILNGGFAGKLQYVSPEQLGLFGGDVTPKSDIYSFGLVIAEALRGKPLDMGGSQADVVEKRRTVPDLSGVDVSLRPLLTAMLAPDPKDRPENMAEIAAWGEGTTVIRPHEPVVEPVRPPPRKLPIAAAAAAIVLLALGGAAYVLRDSLGFGAKTAVAPTETPTAAAGFTPPPLSSSPPAVGPSAPTTLETPTLPPTPSEAEAKPEPTPSPTKTASQGTPPSGGDIARLLPPGAPSPEMALAPATVGMAYRAELPAFTDPSGAGLTLHATPAPPAGLAFKDLGGGRSEITGNPAAAGNAAFDVVAVTQAGQKAKMKVALDVHPGAKVLPPTPSQSVVELQPATAGAAYSAGLPPFRSAAAVTLSAGLGMPEGLTLNDLGNGLSQLAGAPKAAGEFAFDVIASAADGAQGRMKVRITVAPATETPTVAAVSPTETPAVSIADFLRDYGAGPCFAAWAKGDDPSGRSITAIAVDPNTFEAFGAAFEKAVRLEPDVHGLLVGQRQCPAIDFLKSASASPKGSPRIVLDSPLVGKNRPLSGTVLGLAGRAPLLLVVDDDGDAFRLRVQLKPDGQSATFLSNLSGDASSIGKPQMLMAVASDRPIGPEKISGAPSAALMPKLAAEGRETQAGAAVALFKLVE